MEKKIKKPFWNKTRVAIFSSLLTSITLIIVAIISGLFSMNSGKGNPENQISVSDNKIETEVLNNSLKDLDQTNNNLGDVNNEFVTGDKITNYSNTVSKNMDSSSKSPIIGKNVNTGTNNGIIGDNVTVNSPIQPHPSPEIVQGFIDDYPDKNSKLKFMYRSDSRMSNIYAQELIEILRKAGYNSIGWEIDISNSMRADKRGIHLVDDKGDGYTRYFFQIDE